MSVFDAFLRELRNEEPWRSTIDDPQSRHFGSYNILERLLRDIETRDDPEALELRGPVCALLGQRLSVQEKFIALHRIIMEYE